MNGIVINIGPQYKVNLAPERRLYEVLIDNGR